MIWLWREFNMLNQINVLNLLKMLKKPTNVDFGNGAGHKVSKATNAHGQPTVGLVVGVYMFSFSTCWTDTP